jgi:hypothetical protein
VTIVLTRGGAAAAGEMPNRAPSSSSSSSSSNSSSSSSAKDARGAAVPVLLIQPVHMAPMQLSSTGSKSTAVEAPCRQPFTAAAAAAGTAGVTLRAHALTTDCMLINQAAGTDSSSSAKE